MLFGWSHRIPVTVLDSRPCMIDRDFRICPKQIELIHISLTGLPKNIRSRIAA